MSADALTNVTLTPNDMAREIAALRESERILQQQIDRQAREIDRLRDVTAELELCADCGHVESAHSKDGETDCNASGARLGKCTCVYFIPGGGS